MDRIVGDCFFIGHKCSSAVNRDFKRRAWRWIYIASAVRALYLNEFVGVVQTFQKVPFSKALAPTHTEPPFAIAQSLVPALFAVRGIAAVKRFHPAAVHVPPTGEPFIPRACCGRTEHTLTLPRRKPLRA